MPITRFTIAAAASILMSDVGAAPAHQSVSLDARPFSFPNLRTNQPCPISTGRLDAVPSQPQIFGGGGFWFGEGPVFVGLFWKESDQNRAVFDMEPIPRDRNRNAYSAKTGFVIDPSYSGPILIRGHALGAEGSPLVFRALDWNPDPVLHLWSPTVSPATLWSFWPTLMWVPGPGCYGVQLDTHSTTDVVVFEATYKRYPRSGAIAR
jgi:hypothetical protein